PAEIRSLLVLLVAAARQPAGKIVEAGRRSGNRLIMSVHRRTAAGANVRHRTATPQSLSAAVAQAFLRHRGCCDCNSCHLSGLAADGTQPLRQVLMKLLRSAPDRPLVLASALHCFIFCCWEFNFESLAAG